MKTTVSIIKADIGSVGGHAVTHQKLMDTCNAHLSKAKEEGLLTDFYITHCGDDIDMIMTHTNGPDNEEVHKLAFDTFMDGAEVAKGLKLYGQVKIY